ncbi:MAG: PH domain-containing protein [Nostocoides sp.]
MSAAPAPGPVPAPVLDPAPGDGWRRLDHRMLLVYPVTELIRFLPAIAAIFIFGRSSGPDDGSRWWHYGALVVVAALGVLRYLTTTYRITPEQVQVRKGFVNRHTLSARVDRVRTVDLTSSPIHRVLGLSKVVIGTGTVARDRDERLQLDSLGTEAARALRAELLHRGSSHAQPAVAAAAGVDVIAPAGAGELTSNGPGPVVPGPVGADRVIVRLDPGWVRYAPLTMSGVISSAAALGFLANGINQAGNNLWGSIADRAQSVSVPWPLLAGLGVAAGLVLVSVLAILGYLLTNWGLTVSHNALGHSYHLRRGLLTTRETSIDDDRIRGVELGEPLGLRLAGGARLTVIVTGLNKKDRSSSTLVPPAPADVVDRVARDVLDEPDPITTDLVPHGPAARRRRWTRALVPTGILTVVIVVLVLRFDWPAWLFAVVVVAIASVVPLARDRYAGLGHALTGRYVVVRSGSLSRRRDVIERDGIIGWNLDSSFFQRRAGLVSLVATTAAGRGAYAAYDMEDAVAVAFAGAATPGLLDQFRA